MNKLEPPRYAIHRQFRDFDQLCESAQQWNLDLRQLDRGSFCGELLQYGLGGVHVSEAYFDRNLLQAGSPPEGLRTIAVPAETGIQFEWRGFKITGEELLVFPRGAELFATSHPGFHVYTCSFPESMLSELAESRGFDSLDRVRGDASAVRCQPATLNSVRRCLSQLSRRVIRAETLDDQAIIDQARHELPTRLLSAIVTGHGVNTPKTTRKREMALSLAEEFILNHARDDINVREICRAAKVSQRTLEYAFVERYGITPKAFLRVHRLNQVRRDLRHANSNSVRVSDIANEWGFWHMGQFASDYRTHFGELPSQTMQKGTMGHAEALSDLRMRAPD